MVIFLYLEIAITNGALPVSLLLYLIVANLLIANLGGLALIAKRLS
jgi:hypothetical protein